jgi:hypothetical protein
MKCTATELEVETIFNRINSNDISLQPDFQRGEVWSSQKKKKLIDSILRGWRIPPIHVIENKDSFIDEVLDGQQRLATIRDFMNNKIKIDGTLMPLNTDIEFLHGRTFSELDIETQRRFKKYSVTIIRLTEYTPEEPAELFYRLNQPASLTSAEQRNAFIGDTRNQIRELVHTFESNGADKESIGFSNSRMAYDDIISKFCYTLETGSLRRKITSTDISEKYRNNKAFSPYVYENASNVLSFFSKSVTHYSNYGLRKLSLNKATLFSWLVFTKRHINVLSYEQLSQLIFQFEFEREYAKGKARNNLFETSSPYFDKYIFYENMFLLFNQRASMGSTDATSIMIRDIILEIFACINIKEKFNQEVFEKFSCIYSEVQNLPHSIDRTIEITNWGRV